MGNRVCIPKEKLIQMFWGESAQERTSDVVRIFSGRFSLEEIVKQVETGIGEAAEYHKKQIETFAKKNVHNEIANAVMLADFYLPDCQSEICFQMKNSLTFLYNTYCLVHKKK